MATERPDVLIVGAGVVGTALALALAERGAHVTVVDRGPVGHGCSYGNAGWLTPCLATPLPAPGLLGKALRWLFDAESPLYIQPRLGSLGWLLRFIVSTGSARYRAGTAALTALSRDSLDTFAALAREEDTFAFRRDGILVACETEGGLAGARDDLLVAAEQGIAGEALSREAVLACEPALRGPVAGGVFYPDEATVEPLAAVEMLARRAARAGARILPGIEVFDFAIEGDSVSRVATTRGWMSAAVVVLPAGSWSHALARRIGLRLPILGGKGYAVVVPTFDGAPRRPVMLYERKIAATPRAGTLRLAGTLELCDGDLSISPRRVGAILRGGRELLGLPADAPVHEVWRGLRPCTPDGLPVIGFADAPQNLFLCSGHQMLGLHTATGTARLAADLIFGEKPPFDPHPFRPDRF